jgi:hypothetical protein
VTKSRQSKTRVGRCQWYNLKTSAYNKTKRKTVIVINGEILINVATWPITIIIRQKVKLNLDWRQWLSSYEISVKLRQDIWTNNLTLCDRSFLELLCFDHFRRTVLVCSPAIGWRVQYWIMIMVICSIMLSNHVFWMGS